MEYRVLPGTELKVSRVCMGTMTFGSQVDETGAQKMIDHCLDQGVNFFDTANAYNRGRSEEILGQTLKGRRSSVIVASKVFNKMGDGPDEQGLSRTAMRKAIDATLARLGTDYVDVYYLHQPDYNTPIEESLETMQELVKEGKVRYPASSNYASWQIVQMFGICDKRGWQPPRIGQPMYNLVARGIEQEYLPFSQQFQISNFVYNPLAAGLLTGKQRPESGPVAGSRFDGNQMYLNRYWHDELFRAVDELKKIAAESGRTPVEFALSWVLQHPGVAGVILGASKQEQLEENIKATASGPLPETAMEACNAVWTQLRGVTPKYNR